MRNSKTTPKEKDFVSQPGARDSVTYTGPAGEKKVDYLPEVKRALRGLGVEVEPTKYSPLPKRNWFILFALGAVFIAALVFYSMSNARLIVIGKDWVETIEQLLLAVVLFSGVLLLARMLEDVVVPTIDDAASRFNLRRIIRLIVGLILGLAIPSLLLENWYTALFSLGLISMVLGLALQTPITSFIGWLYIIVRSPFRVGDRIMIGDAAGDVIDVGYLDTTLWEFGGPYLSTDHPSGRIIKFPNSSVLNFPVYNYSWPLFPYIWDEVKFHLAYNSDLEFVSKVMTDAAIEEIGDEMIARVRDYHDILAKTPVDEIYVQETPVVLFRVSNNTWIEAIVRYLVEPKEAGRVKTNLVRKMLVQLNAEPERVMFPRGDAR